MTQMSNLTLKTHIVEYTAVLVVKCGISNTIVLEIP